MTSSERRTTTIFLAALALIALAGGAIRVAYAQARQDKPLGGDALFYHAGGNLLERGHGFVNPYVYVDDGVLEPAADHPPLQTMFVAAVSATGLRSQTDHIYAGVVLGTLTVVMGGLAGRTIAGNRFGLISAMLLAVAPNVWRHDALVMSETTAVFATVLTIWLAYRYLERPGVWRLVAVGAAVGLATLARPELLLLSVLMIVPMLWVTTRGRPPLERLGWLAATAAACITVIAPWGALNLARFDRTVILSSQFEVTFATANCESTYYGGLIGYWDLHCADRLREEAGVDAQSDEAAALLGAAGRQYVRDNLRQVPRVVAARLGRLTGLYRPDQQVDIDVLLEGNTRSVASAGMWTLYPTMLLSVAGAVALRRRRVSLIPLVAPIGVVLVSVIVLYTATRFRAPADAVMCFLMAAAFDGLWVWLRDRARPSATVG